MIRRTKKLVKIDNLILIIFDLIELVFLSKMNFSFQNYLKLKNRDPPTPNSGNVIEGYHK